MAGKRLDWTAELECWLEPFLNRLGHKTRRRMCPLYILGLIGPGERKSVQPMAERVVRAVMTNCIISWRPVSGMRHRWRRNCLSRRTGLWEEKALYW